MQLVPAAWGIGGAKTMQSKTFHLCQSIFHDDHTTETLEYDYPKNISAVSKALVTGILEVCLTMESMPTSVTTTEVFSFS